MTEAVIDASVAIRWFEPAEGQVPGPAQALLDQYESGRLHVVVPPLIFLELLNAAGRGWRWSEDALVTLTTRLESMRFDVLEPALDRVARWTARGLTAYDATYVALAEERGIPLLTNDREILAVAGGIAQPVASS
ncbi:MAG: type II toxin-antitoxin system VapC family toxin [Chloroflexota bacterium]|nr:type II toxin-antitoxin system VapC family toxin [Chloroflexota bacterium]